MCKALYQGDARKVQKASETREQKTRNVGMAKIHMAA